MIPEVSTKRPSSNTGGARSRLWDSLAPRPSREAPTHWNWNATSWCQQRSTSVDRRQYREDQSTNRARRRQRTDHTRSRRDLPGAANAGGSRHLRECGRRDRVVFRVAQEPGPRPVRTPRERRRGIRGEHRTSADDGDCGTAASREELRRLPALRDLRTAAYVSAINKVAATYIDLGIFP